MANEVVEKKETQVAEVKESRNKVTDFSLGIFGTSDNFIMATQMAKALSNSSIVPRDYQGNFSNSIVAIDISQRLSVSPLMVMQNLNIIQGRPSWSAQFLIAMVNGSGKYDMELQFEETKDKNGKPFSCYCWTEKKGRRVEGITVDMDMAKDEGWLNKNGSKWKTMPQVMLRYRAASFFARMECPELTIGFYSQDEIIDGDFKEYSIEDMKKSVEKEIKNNANMVDFEPEVIESAAVEAEVVEDVDLPDFMKTE